MRVFRIVALGCPDLRDISTSRQLRPALLSALASCAALPRPSLDSYLPPSMAVAAKSYLRIYHYIGPDLVIYLRFDENPHAVGFFYT